ncbi:hypothetical protein SK128_025012 [Halocaridina rubra]|uniref:Uncharacterized protein n=1 Tax=Halocaridina rubra TaxID=373956 RepID=A0AAN8ZZB8_HALRR
MSCAHTHTHCEYHRGGCVVSVAAPVGFKCQCHYVGAWSCTGTAYPCVGKEQCPGYLADYCACKLGGGDCGGYREPLTNCDETIERARIGVVGWAQQCAANEVCLGEDYSYCGCKNGGGDCGGYPDKPYCPSPFHSPTCDCDRASDWSRGLYTIDEVDYDTENVRIHSLKPVTLAEKDIPNYSGTTQTISLSVGEAVTQTSSYNYQSGVEIAVGVGFVAGYPAVGGVGARVGVTGSYSHTWGQTESLESMFTGTFTCNGAPHKYTKCSVTMKKARVTVPYVMSVKHKVIPNCVCPSYGVWSGTQAYNAKLYSEEHGDCFSSQCIDVRSQ